MRLTSSSLVLTSWVADSGNQPRRSHRVIRVSSSAADPCAMARNCAFSFRDSDYWAQGVNFGFEFRY